MKWSVTNFLNKVTCYFKLITFSALLVTAVTFFPPMLATPTPLPADSIRSECGPCALNIWKRDQNLGFRNYPAGWSMTDSYPGQQIDGLISYHW